MNVAIPVDVTGPAAPPRSNGELVFDAPWQQRAFGVVFALTESGAIEWSRFRDGLITRIAQSADRPYWRSWAMALEDALAAADLLSVGTIDERQSALVSDHPDHDHG
ncbi:nitrile hydratase accessory protein [Antrihabitans spumae]|uniref:Nitrile hydratase accessory protein n=1 Tax=Antrihabitans spumae TaxID=3373370 RepID=A0ABW7KFK9_9NOCA